MEDADLIKKEMILSSADIFSSVVTLVVVVQSLWSLTTTLILLFKCDTCLFIFDGLLLFLMVGKKESTAINLLLINNSSKFILSGL